MNFYTDKQLAAFTNIIMDVHATATSLFKKQEYWTWNGILTELSKIKFQNKDQQDELKRLISEWTIDTVDMRIITFPVFERLFKKEQAKAELVSRIKKETGRSVDDLMKEQLENFVPIANGYDYEKFSELEHIINRAMCNVDYDMSLVTPVAFAQLIKNIINELNWKGKLDTESAKVLLYIIEAIASQVSDKSTNIYSTLLSTVCQKVINEKHYSLTVEKLIEILDERISMGDFSDEAPSPVTEEDLAMFEIPANFDDLIDKFKTAGWNINEIQLGIVALSNKKYKDVTYILGRNGDGCVVSFNKNIKDIKEILEQQLKEFQDQSNIDSFWETHRVLIKGKKVMVLVKKTISINGKILSEYWFHKKPAIPQKILDKCKFPDDFKKEILKFEATHEDKSGNDEDDFVHEGDLKGWVEIK